MNINNNIRNERKLYNINEGVPTKALISQKLQKFVPNQSQCNVFCYLMC